MLTFIALRHKKILLRWRSVLHTDRGVGGVMLTFIALRHKKMLLRWRSVLHTDGEVGWGGMLTFIALRHKKMLLRWSCCYVENVVAESLVKIGKAQLRRMGQLGGPTDKLEHRKNMSAFYVHRKPGLQSVLEALKCHRHKVNGACAPMNAFKTALWMWREKRPMCILPMILWWIMTFLRLSKETWNSKKHSIPMGKANTI